MTPKLDPRSARKHPERAKPIVVEHDGTAFRACEISQLPELAVYACKPNLAS